MLVNWAGFLLQPQPDRNQEPTRYTAPKRARFRIIREEQDRYIVRFTYVPAAISGRTLNAAAVGQTPPVETGENYWIEKENLPDFNYELHSGLDYGELTLPFKLQLSDGSLTTGSTVGGFIGYRWRPLFGIPTTVLISGGLAGIPVTDVNAASVHTEFGLTAAAGFVFTIAGQFQMGFIVGRDHISGPARARFPYQGKTWASASIGFAFIK